MNIKKRKDGRYLINVYIGNVDGKPRYKSVYGKTISEVKKKATLIKAEQYKGVEILSGDNSTFKFWAEAWLNTVEKKTTEEWFRVLSARADYFINFFDRADINKIKAVDCEYCIDEIAKSNPNNYGKAASKNTVKGYKSVLVRIFDFCIQNRVVSFNPAKGVIIKETEKATEIRKPLSDFEIDLIWKTPHLLQPACLIMIYCGLRRGEVLALTWNDIDFENKLITVNKSVNLLNNGTVKSPKTVAGVRKVPIPKILLDYLNEIPHDNLLIVHKNGQMVKTDGVWKRSFNNYIKRINELNGVSFSTTAHCLRHTYATILYEAGIDVLSAKAYMGHSDFSTTMKIYTHLREEKEKNNISKLDSFLSSTNKDSAAY